MTTTNVSDMTPSRFVAFATELSHDLSSWVDAECVVGGPARWESGELTPTYSSDPDNARAHSSTQ